jgi:Pyridoxamine 5'-phosphate oxidase
LNWSEFSSAAPELADLGRPLFEKSGLSLIGTNRKDGWPRISPCEVYFVDGEMTFGVMWQSMKARDMLRDPRIVVHTPQADKSAVDGDLKLYGRGIEVPDGDLKEKVKKAIYDVWKWAPEDPYHVFKMDIEWASFIRFGKDQIVLRWSTGSEVERMRHPDDPKT